MSSLLGSWLDSMWSRSGKVVDASGASGKGDGQKGGESMGAYRVVGGGVYGLALSMICWVLGSKCPDAEGAVWAVARAVGVMGM